MQRVAFLFSYWTSSWASKLLAVRVIAVIQEQSNNVTGACVRGKMKVESAPCLDAAANRSHAPADRQQRHPLRNQAVLQQGDAHVPDVLHQRRDRK